MSDDRAELTRVALMRYAEQLLQSVPVPIGPGAITEETCAQLLKDFDAEYERQFGAFAKALFAAVEVFAVRVEARVPAEVRDARADAPSEPARPTGTRQVHWPDTGPAGTPIYDGATLAAGQAIDGPAVIELAYTTVPIARGQRLTRDAETDNLLLDLEG
jgi:N-methylhydantoinase A